MKTRSRKDLKGRMDGFRQMTGIDIVMFDAGTSGLKQKELQFLSASCIWQLMGKKEDVIVAETACGLLYGVFQYCEMKWLVGPVVLNNTEVEISKSTFEHYLMMLICSVTGKDIAEVRCGYTTEEEVLSCTSEQTVCKMEDKRLAGCVKFVRENIGETLSLKRIAAHCGYNPAYLSRKFKEIYGINLNRFILETRLKMTAEYLKNTEKPLVEISEEFCFSSQSHFQNAFKAVYKMTPMEYRRIHRSAVA